MKKKETGRFEYLDRLDITINITPKANVETATTRSGKSYTPKEKKEYMRACIKQIRQHEGWCEDRKQPIKAVFKFFFSRAESKYKTKSTDYFMTNKPDTENLVKPVKDCLGNGIFAKVSKYEIERGAGILVDDAQIVMESATKIWSDRSRIEISLFKIRDTLAGQSLKQRTLL